MIIITRQQLFFRTAAVFVSVGKSNRLIGSLISLTALYKFFDADFLFTENYDILAIVWVNRKRGTLFGHHVRGNFI